MEKKNLNDFAPMKEPDRQYYFMNQAKLYVKELERQLGRKPTFSVQTFGCQMNSRDSEKLIGILEKVGYVPVSGGIHGENSNEEADFLIYNTCTVRENANNRLFGRLGHIGNYKKQHPYMKIAICGCMMQEPKAVEKIKTSYRFVDLIFGTHNIYKFAELICSTFESDSLVIDIWEDTDKIVEDLPVERKYSFKSGVNVMFGCNNFCSYCIVPYVRGRERSRNRSDILREITALAEDGVVEVMLLGQNVNSYGNDLEDEITFPGLLEEIEKIDGIERIRFMTSHPKDLSDELIEVMAKSEKICRHLHLPLQSGSSKVLKAMNRKYTKEQFLELAGKIQTAMPDYSITTDIIVGFPGESEEDFAETLEVVEKVAFDQAFTFQYSKRSGTPAAAMEDQVSEEVMKERFPRLLDLMKGISREKSRALVGQVQKALIEEVNSHGNGLVTGRLSNNSLVHLAGDESMIGKILNVSLDEGKGFYYLGKVV